MTAEEIYERTERQAYLQEWKRDNPYFLSFREQYNEPDYMLRIGGVGCVPRGDICAIKAKAKNGKTTLIGVFIVAMMTGAAGHITAEASGLRVMYVDTEQNASNTMANARRWKRQAGMDEEKDDERMWIANVRTMPKEERTKFIERAIFDRNPDVVVVDGIRDLLGDFNDIDESGQLIETLMRWTTEYKINLMCVLHENKSKDDTNMRGHLGTELLNKCADVFEVRKDEKDKSHFFVEQTETRNAPADDFDLRRNEDGSVEVGTNTRPPLYSKETFTALLEKGGLGHNELAEAYAKAMGCHYNTGKNHIRLAWQDGFITNDLGVYTLKT